MCKARTVTVCYIMKCTQYVLVALILLLVDHRLLTICWLSHGLSVIQPLKQEIAGERIQTIFRVDFVKYLVCF